MSDTLTDDQHDWVANALGIDPRSYAAAMPAGVVDATGGAAGAVGDAATQAADMVTSAADDSVAAVVDAVSGITGPMAVSVDAAAKPAAKPKFDGVTTYSMSSREQLAKAGYRFARRDGAFDVWIKVDNSSYIWVQVPKPATPNDPGGNPAPGGGPAPSTPPNPSIQEAKEWAGNLEGRFNELWKEAQQLRAMRDSNGNYPAGPFNDYFAKLSRYDEDLKSVLEGDAQTWLDSAATDDERAALQQFIDRIKKVQDHEPEMDLDDPE